MKFCGHCGTPAAAPATPDPQPAADDVAEALRSFVAGPVADQLVESGGHLPEERRLITALFADVSGFTTLADRLDPEQLLEVIDPVISALSSIVGRYGGYVEKFAGDALLALFGAPVSHEDDAERALLVALEMHSELDRVCGELPHRPELTLHVGVNSGHGIARILGSETRTDYAVLGDSVILAQRLESAAPPGETYVGPMTRRLTEELFDFEHVGELTLKGKAEPVSAWRLLGRRDRAVAAAGSRPLPALMGRASELALTERTLDHLLEGGGGVLSVIGEPGVGKSRLSAEVRAQARSRGVRWLETRCLSYGAGLAYWPYAELLRNLALGGGAEPTATALEAALTEADASEALPYFARLLGVGEGGSENLEPEAFRRGLHGAFALWLRSLAQRGPTVLAIEDVHWADASSLELTGELARLCPEEPFLLYLVARPEAAESLRKVAADAPGREIGLGPLDEGAVHALIAEQLDGLPPAGLAEFVLGRTLGNPLFVGELLRSLRETDALEQLEGSWRLRPGWNADAVPPTLEAVLASRIDLLPRSAAAVLQTASVIGRRVRVPLLRSVSGSGSDLDSDLALLTAAGFLDPQDEDGIRIVSFHHALIQDVAYSRLLRRRRRDLHRRVADTAEALYGAGDDVVDLLARHLYLGEAGPKAVDYLVRAGERAKRLYANEEAILHFTRAAELAAGEDRLADIQLELADLHDLVGAYDDARALYDGVRTRTDDVRAWRGTVATLRKQGEYGRALELLNEAFATEELADADLAPLWLENGWTLSVAGRVDQAVDVLEAGLAACGGRGDAVEGHMLLQLARAMTITGRVDEALERVFEARSIFEAIGDNRGLATTQRILGNVLRRLQRLDEAALALRRGLELAERVGNVEEIGGCLINLGLVEMTRGALAEAIACDRRAIEEFERSGNGSGRAQGYANLAEKLMFAGEYVEATAYCERALALAREIDHGSTVADVIDTMASIGLAEGNLAAAVERAEEAASLYVEMGAVPQAAGSLELAAKAWEAAGEEQRARDSRVRARQLTGGGG